MEFDVRWALLALPIAFGLGWLASRIDLRQWRNAQRSAPKAHVRGLNLLLNEQYDAAIDAFIEAVQDDPEALELHFALGNLFRRRGETERAVRVHEYLLRRADLPLSTLERARFELAQDFMHAGLFDRAEAAFAELQNTSFEIDSRLARLALFERSREWESACQMAERLEHVGAGSFAQRRAHHACELAAEALVRNEPEVAQAQWHLAQTLAPQAPRAYIEAGRHWASLGRHQEALALWQHVLDAGNPAFILVAAEFADAALAAQMQDGSRTALERALRAAPNRVLLEAVLQLEPSAEAREQRRVAWLEEHPESLSTASATLKNLSVPAAIADTVALLSRVITQSSTAQRRYRCAACAFEAERYFWQCPGCLSWDTTPPLILEDQ
jgi:lipopolysaccharide biosynthesis regulator YciM